MMFDFHRHVNNSLLNNEAFYCTSTVEEWSCEKNISLGFLFKKNTNYSKQQLDNILIKLEEKLKINKYYQIGEIGLDKRFNQIEMQSYFLEECIKLSNKYNRILTLHCVREYGNIIKILKQKNEFLGPLTIIHGFNSSFEVAKQLSDLNILISINKAFLKTKAFKDIYKFDKLGFLIESDWTEINDKNYNISLNSFISELDKTEIKNYKDYNFEYRTIFKNFYFNR